MPIVERLGTRHSAEVGRTLTDGAVGGGKGGGEMIASCADVCEQGVDRGRSFGCLVVYVRQNRRGNALQRTKRLLTLATNFSMH